MDFHHYHHSLLKLIAVLIPKALGSNVISKVTLPAAVIGDEGSNVNVKSDAFVPLMTTYGLGSVKFRSAPPLFSIVKVFVT